MKTPDFYISGLDLKPHPEGGWYAETYRSWEKVGKPFLSDDVLGERNMATAIYFLLTEDNFSAFHRIKSDETWHFYDGDGLFVHELKQDGVYVKHQLGLDIASGQRPQFTINARSWFASEVMANGSWCLVGCTVSPGFDFQDFEMAEQNELSSEYPRHYNLIARLTRS